MKKILLLLTAILTVLTLISCGGCTEHTDADGDLCCDACGEKMPETDLYLVKNGIATFNIVYSEGLGAVPSQLKKLMNDLEKIDLYIDVFKDGDAKEIDCEVLVGNITSRGEQYVYDSHSLGKEGYIIKRIGNKIIISAGSNDALSLAFEKFTKDILGFTEGKTKELKEVTVSNSDTVLKKQNNYLVDLTLLGKAPTGYTIACDVNDFDYFAEAQIIQDTLYTTAGIFMDIVDLSSRGDRSVVLRHTEDFGDGGFTVKFDGEALYISCATTTSFQALLQTS
jgi:hypothetical protein